MVSMLYIIIGKEAKITLKKPVKFGLDILTKLHFLDKKIRIVRPWWWSSGQSARLLL